MSEVIVLSHCFFKTNKLVQKIDFEAIAQGCPTCLLVSSTSNFFYKHAIDHYGNAAADNKMFMVQMTVCLLSYSIHR